MNALRPNEVDLSPAINLLATVFEVPPVEVARLYKNELAKLEARASVRIYLHLFAFRKARDVLRQRDQTQG